MFIRKSNILILLTKTIINHIIKNKFNLCNNNNCNHKNSSAINSVLIQYNSFYSNNKNNMCTELTTRIGDKMRRKS